MSVFRRHGPASPPPRRTYGVALRWDGSATWCLASTGTGADGPGWTARCRPDDLAVTLADGLVADRALPEGSIDRDAWFAADAAPMDRYRRLADTGIVGARWFTVAPSTGLMVVGWRLTWPLTKEGRSRLLTPGDVEDGAAVRIPPGADDLTTAAAAAQWLEGHRSDDYRAGAFHRPVPGSSEPWAPVLAADVPRAVAEFLGGGDAPSADDPAVFGLDSPGPAVARWYLLMLWDPARLDGPCGWLGMARGTDGSIRWYAWLVESGPSPQQISVRGADSWPAEATPVRRLLRELLRAGDIPAGWSLGGTS